MGEPEAFTGWARVGRGPWQRVCAADSEERCWHLLLDWRPRVDKAWQSVDRVVLPRGKHPGTDGRTTSAAN
jgi:hypothetical protein